MLYWPRPVAGIIVTERKVKLTLHSLFITSINPDPMLYWPRPVAGILQQGGTKTTREAHFLYTILDVCSNRGAKHQNGVAGQHWPPS